MLSPEPPHASLSLPASFVYGAIVRDREYAWDLAAFPEALRLAPDLGYACLGEQFWMILTSGALYEPYWLDADSSIDCRMRLGPSSR